MTIRPSAEARATQTHPLVRAHPETGRLGLFSTLGYIVGIEGMAQEEAIPLLRELAQWQGREAFQYRHRWEAGTLVMWDNRSALHCATRLQDTTAFSTAPPSRPLKPPRLVGGLPLLGPKV